MRPAAWRSALHGSGSLPNQLTAARLALVPAIWLLALTGRPALVGAGALLAGLTDVVDGPIARRTHTASRFGSAFDSFADHLLNASIVLWLALLRPEFFREHLALLAAWAALGAAALAAGWIRFRRIGNLHLYSAKLAGVAAYLFAAWVLIRGTYAPWIFYVVLFLATLSALETLLVFLTRSRVDEHTGSLLL